MFKNFLSVIVGGDDGPTKPAEPTRPPSLPPSGRSTPLSETGSMMGPRRGSCSSLHSQISPVESSELDLSQLSREEREQIEAVIARAREMQEEGEQRVREIEEDFGGPFQFAPVKPPAQSIKPTSGPPTAVKPVPQTAGLQKGPPHKSPSPQPLTAASKAPHTQSTRAEPPKTLPKPVGGSTATKPTPGRDGSSQPQASQRTDLHTKQKHKDNSSDPGDRPQQANSSQSQRTMTRPAERTQQSASNNKSGSVKGGQLSKSEVKVKDQTSGQPDKQPIGGGSVTKQGNFSRVADTKTQPQPTKGKDVRSGEQRGEQVLPSSSHNQPTGQPPSQFKPYPKAADTVPNKPLQDQPHPPIPSQQANISYGNSSKQGPGRAGERPSAGDISLQQTSGDVRQQTRQGQRDVVQNAKQSHQVHQSEQKRQDQAKHPHGEDKQQFHSQRAVKTVSAEQQQQQANIGNSAGRKAPPTQAKPRESQQAGELRPHMKSAKAKSPKPAQKNTDLEDGAMCPLCTSNELNSHTASLCNVCETNICLNCGSFETSPRTKLKEWLCKICSQERRVMMEKKKGQMPSASAQNPQATLRSPSERHKNQRSSPEPGQKPHKPKPASAIDSSQRTRQPDYSSSTCPDDTKAHIARPTEFKQIFPVHRSQQKPPPVHVEGQDKGPKHGTNEQKKQGEKGVKAQQPHPSMPKQDPSVRMVPKIVSGTIQMVQVTEEAERPQNVQQADRPPGVQQADRPPGEQKADRPPGLQQADRYQGVQQADRPSGVQQADRPQGVQKTDRPPGVQQADRPQGVQKTDRPPGVQQADRPQAVHQADRLPGVQKTGRPPAVQQTDKPPGVQRADRTQTVQQTDKPQAVLKTGSVGMKADTDTTKRPDNINIKEIRKESQKDQQPNLQSNAEVKRSPDKGKSPKSPRPNNLDINKKGAAKTQQTEKRPVAAEKVKPSDTKEVTDVSTQLSVVKNDNIHKSDPQKPIRSRGEGGDTLSSKMKPSPLDRVSLAEGAEVEKCSTSRRSPSRISPRSPQGSPSWIRYRESPPRSPNLKKHSPTKSPVERFPSNYGDIPPVECDAIAYGEEFHFPSTNTMPSTLEMVNTTENHSNDVPPPKPARMSNQYGATGTKYDNMAQPSLDLASYAATVASSTAHLTSMSVSPTNVSQSDEQCKTLTTQSGGRGSCEMSPDMGSMSPPSPNFYDDSDEMEMAEPSEKSIDYGNKRQKIKPPATDWSPITDLSPIIDVSPSLERIEQEKMMQEQRGGTSREQETEKLMKASRLERQKGPEDVSSQEAQIKQANKLSKGEVSNESLARQSRIDIHHHVGLPHANSEPSKPTQTVSYPTRQAQSLDADSRFAPNKDSSPDKLYHSHPSFEGDREIDLDVDIPPQKRDLEKPSTSATSDSDTARSSSDGQNVTFERQGGLVRSKLQMFSKDMVASDSDSSEHKSSKTESKKTLATLEQDEKSPKLLTSPESPKQAVAIGLDPPKDVSVSKLTSSKEFTYPSPVTSPEKPTSPPCPASPSASSSSSLSLVSGSSRKPSAVSRSKSLDEGHITAVRKSRSWDKSNLSPQSPGSDKERKTRRKLPTLPSSEKLEPTPPQNTNMNSDKEILRKRLQEKAGRSRLQNKLENDSKIRPQSAPPTNNKGENCRSLPKKPPATAPKPKLPKILGSKQNAKERPPVPPKPRSRNSSITQEELDQEDTVSIFGVEVPLSVRSMKQRIREEIQIVTATRRLKIDEMEEVRIMERKMADREKMRRIRIEEEARKKAKLKEEEEREKEKLKKLEKEIQKQRDVERQLEKERVEAEEKVLADKLARLEKEKEKYSRSEKEKAKVNTGGSNTLSIVKMSPQSSPRRGKHRRQNSDPMLAKFSPIEEKDIENDMSYRLGLEARKLTSNLSRFSPQPGRKCSRSGSVTPTMTYSDYVDPLMTGTLLGSGRSKSSEILTMIDKDAMLASSHSETNIPLSMMQRSRTHHFESEMDDKLSKEEKRQQLQVEIEKRRKALEENARLRYEIQKLTEAANVAPYEFEEIKTKYNQHLRAKESVPTGIIRPLDTAAAEEQANQFSAKDYTSYRELMQRSAGGSTGYPDTTYSCSEYVAHQRSDKSMQNGAATYFLQPPGESTIPHGYHKGMSPTDLELIEKLGYQHALGQKYPIDSFTGSRDSGLSSGSNLLMDHGYLATKPEHDACNPNDAQSEASITTTDTTPPSLKDVTPAMPILDDVTLRSRSKLRQIGSRPLSDDMGQYIDGSGADLTSMFHAESDLSVAESDDHVMEGGVTIKESRDVKRPKTKDSAERRSYGFDIKRILLTKDPKERSVAGNGIGMKIVGGKIIPGTEEVGAYVADIYPGGVADQLHGELQEGDQVLEWNGITLTGKTYEEVQHIISQPNGEIELVVRPGLMHKPELMIPYSRGAKLSCKDQTMSTIRSESCHSSYDNLEPKVDVDTSDYEEFDGRFIDPRSDIDPDLVAARLAQSQVGSSHHPSHPPTKQTPLRPGQAPPEHHISPGASPSSSQQDVYLTPSVSMSGSTQSDPIEAPPSPTVELPNLGADPDMDGRDPHDWGEIQLQLSYDDYDGTLNIHVMQAKGLRPKDRNGLSDPFVKCYLLPGRIGENKRRTKIINRCLDPEWHQTLVFMKISKDDLRTKTLEVTVWDYDRRNRNKAFKPNDFLGVVYLDLGDLSILDNKPHWYKLHEPDDDMANQLSKPVTYAPQGSKQQVSKPHGHSQPINNSNHHDTPLHDHGGRGDVRYTTSHNRTGSNASSGSHGSHGDRRDLHPPHSEHGAKYSPGLGRRKDIQGHRNENCERSPKKIYLDLTSSNCDNEEFLYSVQANGITNMAMHVNQKQGTNNNHSPLLTAYKSRQLASDTVSMSSTSSGISFDSRIVKSSSDVINDNTPVKNIVNTMYSFLGPGQLLTNTRTKANGLAIVSGAAYAVTGEILLGLRKNQSELVVSVIHCKGVTKRVLVAEAVQDWYMKVYLHEESGHQSKVKKYKTTTQRTERDPTFHETFAITTNFVEAFLEVSLWINRGMFGQNKAIGTTIIALKNVEFASFKNNELMAYYKFLAPK